MELDTKNVDLTKLSVLQKLKIGKQIFDEIEKAKKENVKLCTLFLTTNKVYKKNKHRVVLYAIKEGRIDKTNKRRKVA